MDQNVNSQKILVIEGDGFLGEQVVAELKHQGFPNATVVKNGVDGLKAIYDILPHLILLDVTLPGMNGYDVLAQKQAEPLLAKIPVFLMSTQGVPVNMHSVPAGSVSEFITALHADPKDIVSKIKRHFASSVAATAPGQPPAAKKLLWVEDDKLIGTILGKKLVSSGFELYHAENGEQALEMLKTIIPDLIVVDLILPGMSGFDILQKIDEDSVMRNVPRLVLSNLSKPSDIEKARALGAKKFLVKAATSLEQIVNEIRQTSAADRV